MNGDLETRGGLGELPQRLRERPCAVAYFGASLTAQKDGYRPRVHEWLVHSTGQPHRAVNAGLGGVGSISAVFAMDDLVLRHRPDLCLIEYATGDMESRSPLSQLGPVLEGIVRKLLAIDCAPVFLHLYRPERRYAPPDAVIATYERVAAHYGIPSINLGAWLERGAASGALQLDDLLRDGIHLRERGAVMMADLLTAALQEIFTGGDGEAALGREETPPLFTDHYQFTRVVPAEPAMLRHPSRCERHTLRFFYPYVQIEGDNAVECRLDAEVAGLIVAVGRESGQIRIRTPSREREQMLWDEFCFYDRYETVLFHPSLPPGTPLCIELTDAPVDYARCRRPLENVEAIRRNLKLIGFMAREKT